MPDVLHTDQGRNFESALKGSVPATGSGQNENDPLPPSIRRFGREMHWGSSDTIEAYIQESGRAGRDDTQACALLLVKKKDLSRKFLDADIITYSTNTVVCRRSLLLKNFDFIDFQKDCKGCLCCDICAHECNCMYPNFVLSLSDVKPIC